MKGKTQYFDTRQTMHTPGFEIFHYRDDSPASVHLHHHDYYEIYFLISGRMEYLIEGRNYQLIPGDMLLISPMELHQPIINAELEVFERIVLWVDREFMKKHSTEHYDLSQCFARCTAEYSANLLHPTPTQWADITLRLEELLRERSIQDIGSKQYEEGVLLQLLVEIDRLALRNKRPVAESSDETSLIAQVLAYVNAHYGENIPLERLAQHFYISKYHLAHEFKRVFGISLHQYIILKRLLIAKQMISGGTPVGVAATNCGFSNYTNFYRAFLSQYGVNPRDCLPGKGKSDHAQ